MKFDLERISESKREFRRRLAARPIAEKLRLLDALRERTLAIRQPVKPAPEPRGLLQQTRHELK
jgi:hypothetical protein